MLFVHSFEYPLSIYYVQALGIYDSEQSPPELLDLGALESAQYLKLILLLPLFDR